MKILFIECTVEHGMSVMRYGIEREEGDYAEFNAFIAKNQLECESPHIYSHKEPFKNAEA